MSAPINRIDEAAATWALRLGTRPLSPEEQRELDAWIAADVRHHGALIRARSAWTGLDRFAALAAGGSTGITDARHSPAAAPPYTLPSPSRRWMLAAGLSAMTVGTAAWLGLRGRGAYVTEVGEFRSIALPDGSVMRLNTDSKALVGYGESHREVTLLRGEAMFEVAKDPARPFLVRTGQLVVRAVGTAFAVRVAAASVDVTVTEGVVEISGNASKRILAPQAVKANERAVTQRDSLKVEPISREEVRRRLAWRNGMVSFDGQPLRSAVAEVNRYGQRPIVITDAQLAEQPIVGMFRAGDTETFAKTAAAALGAEVVVDGEVITIQAAHSQ